jgi:hypothetical protein
VSAPPHHSVHSYPLTNATRHTTPCHNFHSFIATTHPVVRSRHCYSSSLCTAQHIPFFSLLRYSLSLHPHGPYKWLCRHPGPPSLDCSRLFHPNQCTRSTRRYLTMSTMPYNTFQNTHSLHLANITVTTIHSIPSLYVHSKATSAPHSFYIDLVYNTLRRLTKHRYLPIRHRTLSAQSLVKGTQTRAVTPPPF